MNQKHSAKVENMTPVAAPMSLASRLQSLAEGDLAPDSNLSLLKEAGLSDQELHTLIYQSGNEDKRLRPDDVLRLQLVAGLLAHCLQVYGKDNAVGWLHQPLRRFNRQSPLDFLASTRNFAEVDGYLTEVSEGYFF